MATPNFNTTGTESFRIYGATYNCVVYQDIHGAYGARVENEHGTVIAQTYLTYASVTDAWAYAIGALSEFVKGQSHG